MTNQNVTSEWRECRDTISKFDGYLFKLRLSVFTVFSLTLSALVGSTSIHDIRLILEKSEAVLFIFATLSTYILAIYILDRYYERMLMIAVYRASYIETFRLENFKIGLTTEIEFQKEKMLKEAKSKSLFVKYGLKGSAMVNIIYIFLYLLIAILSLYLIDHNEPPFSKIYSIFGGACILFICLGMSANRFLTEPKKLIKLRSQAVKSPIVVSREEILFFVEKIARKIQAHYRGMDVTIVSILNGARPFTNDLMKKLTELEVKYDLHLIRVEATQDNHTNGSVEFIFGENVDFKDKNVLILDDLIDSGKTACIVKNFIAKTHPKDIRIGALMNKFSDTEVKADFVGLNLGLLRSNFPLPNGITDYWLFGYGMDLNEQFRDLDFIGWVETNKTRK